MSSGLVPDSPLAVKTHLPKTRLLTLEAKSDAKTRDKEYATKNENTGMMLDERSNSRSDLVKDSSSIC